MIYTDSKLLLNWSYSDIRDVFTQRACTWDALCFFFLFSCCTETARRDSEPMKLLQSIFTFLWIYILFLPYQNLATSYVCLVVWFHIQGCTNIHPIDQSRSHQFHHHSAGICICVCVMRYGPIINILIYLWRMTQNRYQWHNKDINDTGYVWSKGRADTGPWTICFTVIMPPLWWYFIPVLIWSWHTYRVGDWISCFILRSLLQ